MYSEDIKYICDFINPLKPDIVCLQELTEGFSSGIVDTGAYLAQELGYYSYFEYGPMVLPTGNSAKMGMGIFSKYPLSNSRKIVLQEGVSANGKIIQDERFFLTTNVHINDSEVSVATTHLPFHPTFRTTESKRAMIEQILIYIPAEKKAIFMGDLNSTPYTKAAKLFRESGYKNAGPGFNQPTWTTKPFSTGNLHYDTLEYRIDYILHTDDLLCESSEIIQTELSDHLPIFARFTLK